MVAFPPLSMKPRVSPRGSPNTGKYRFRSFLVMLVISLFFQNDTLSLLCLALHAQEKNRFCNNFSTGCRPCLLVHYANFGVTLCLPRYTQSIVKTHGLSAFSVSGHGYTFIMASLLSKNGKNNSFEYLQHSSTSSFTCIILMHWAFLKAPQALPNRMV